MATADPCRRFDAIAKVVKAVANSQHFPAPAESCVPVNNTQSMKKQKFFGIRHTPGCAVEPLSTTSHASGFLPAARLIPIMLTIALFTMTTARGDTELFACSESGTGTTYLKVCVSNTGNVTLFKSPWGMEHIRVIDGPGNDLWADSSAMEGFMVCRWDPNGWAPGVGDWVGYYDFGGFYPTDPDYPWRFWDYGWNAPHNISQPNGPNKFPLIVSRRSYDERFELKQEFTVDAQERELAMTMTLSNKWACSTM